MREKKRTKGEYEPVVEAAEARHRGLPPLVSQTPSRLMATTDSRSIAIARHKNATPGFQPDRYTRILSEKEIYIHRTRLPAQLISYAMPCILQADMYSLAADSLTVHGDHDGGRIEGKASGRRREDWYMVDKRMTERCARGFNSSRLCRRLQSGIVVVLAWPRGPFHSSYPCCVPPYS